MRNYSAINKIIFSITILYSFLFVNSAKCGTESDSLSEARILFYECVENSKLIDKAMSVFSNIEKHKEHKGVAKTYIGALIALKGKFAFFPIKKLKFVNKGLKIMDEGVALNPYNIEARYIRGMTCYYLPFFFNRKETVKQDFTTIAQLLDSTYNLYDSQIIVNVINFMLDNIELNSENVQSLKKTKQLLKNEQ